MSGRCGLLSGSLGKSSVETEMAKSGVTVKQCIFPAARNCAGKIHKLIDFWLIEQIGADMK